jgi:uncharacterized protein YyaL (SSP411 family)
MALGGMCDQVGGGFHRYSVDERWFVPHFEKMLYDQAQLATSYLEAFQIAREARYAAVARDIFEYVARDLTSPEGAFFSAEDADSAIDPADPHEKGEGAFYIWKSGELEQTLGEDAQWFSRTFGVREDGNVDQDPHHEFTGANILYQATALPVSAERWAEVRTKLRLHRERRARPQLDDKVLTAWNGLMISALCLGAQVLGEGRYYDAARRAADFIFNQLWDGTTLLRRYREGDAAIPGFLDDYAFFGNALLDLYETGFEARFLETAEAIARSLRVKFEDTEQGAFFSSGEGDESLILRLKEDYDGAEPSGNSLAALFLLRLSSMTGEASWRQSAERALQAFASRLRLASISLPQMMVAALFYQATAKQIVVAGERTSPMVAEMVTEARRTFLPTKVVLLADAEARAKRDYLATMTPGENAALAYVCEHFTCQAPVAGVDALAELLKK